MMKASPDGQWRSFCFLSLYHSPCEWNWYVRVFCLSWSLSWLTVYLSGIRVLSPWLRSFTLSPLALISRRLSLLWHIHRTRDVVIANTKVVRCWRLQSVLTPCYGESSLNDVQLINELRILFLVSSVILCFDSGLYLGRGTPYAVTARQPRYYYWTHRRRRQLSLNFEALTGLL